MEDYQDAVAAEREMHAHLQKVKSDDLGLVYGYWSGSSSDSFISIILITTDLKFMVSVMLKSILVIHKQIACELDIHTLT